MRTPILFGVAALVLVPIVSLAASDYLLKLDGVDGETKPTRATVEPLPARAVPTATTVAPPATGGTEAGSMYMKIEGVDGESKDEKKMMLPTQQVGTGAKPAPGVEPDEIDYDGDQETNFAILLQGPSTGDDEEEPEEGDEEKLKGLERAATVILQHAQESGHAIESISLNFTKIEVKMPKETKLFGVIPMKVQTTVEFDAAEEATVKLPWWAFLTSGVDKGAVGEETKKMLKDTLKAKHDSIKNAIGNVR